MTSRPERVLLAMIALQFVHAVEEFIFEFWNAFPPMRAVYGDVSGVGVFVLFHTILIGFGFWCIREIRRQGVSAKAALLAWIAIQTVTLVVHIAWFAADPRYQPGLATTPWFAVTIAAAITALKRERVGIGSRGD